MCNGNLHKIFCTTIMVMVMVLWGGIYVYADNSESELEEANAAMARARQTRAYNGNTVANWEIAVNSWIDAARLLGNRVNLNN